MKLTKRQEEAFAYLIEKLSATTILAPCADILYDIREELEEVWKK